MQLGHCSRHTHKPYYHTPFLPVPHEGYYRHKSRSHTLLPPTTRGYTDASFIPKLLPLPLPVPHKETYTQGVYVC